MQRGIATLEIILAVMIIAVLASSVMPNAIKIVDRVALDYEHKRLYSELRFVQEMGSFDGENPTLFIDKAKNYYQVFREEGLNNPVREPHYFSYGVEIKELPQEKINFDNLKITSDHITLKSRLGKTKEITFDSVGRMR